MAHLFLTIKGVTFLAMATGHGALICMSIEASIVFRNSLGRIWGDVVAAKTADAACEDDFD
jgi:hypothetical protein